MVDLAEVGCSQNLTISIDIVSECSSCIAKVYEKFSSASGSTITCDYLVSAQMQNLVGLAEADFNKLQTGAFFVGNPF